MPIRRIIRSQDGMAALEFALLAPALLMLVFAIIVYSLYFSTLMGVRHAAAEGARAAMAGLSLQERTTLATARAQAVIDNYGALLSSGGPSTITATPDGSGLFTVRVSHNLSGTAMMRYAGFIPLPSPVVSATVSITNGSY